MLKLGTLVKDTVTGLKGMLTHYQMEMLDSNFYHFQPQGLNKKTGEPLHATWVTENRITGGVVETDPPNMRKELLGKKATDAASGFTGTITGLTLHISGCLHAFITPVGLTDSGELKKGHDFDLRRLTGPDIPKWTEKARKADEKKRPSPAPVESFDPLRHFDLVDRH